jgi:RNA polymerase sigma factor (sigma-70 family)
MENTVKTLSLDVIHLAQRGDPDSQGLVAELIRPKVYAYIYRMTLDAHVAEDLCQETMVSLVENLTHLTVKAPSYLWAWVYKAALNQIRDNYRHQRAAQDGITQVKQTSSRFVGNDQVGPTGPERAIRKELLSAVSKAVRGLKLQYRNVLTLRCFQQLSYAEIAQATGNSELGVRMLFFRAKQSLARQLARDGFDKSQLLPALTLFAAATLAPAEKATAAAISAGAIHTGLGVKLLATLGTTKVGVGVAAVLAVSLVPWRCRRPSADSSCSTATS